MAPKLSLLQGELKKDPEIDSGDIERLLAGFLRTLLEEQMESTLSESVAPEAGTPLEGSLP